MSDELDARGTERCVTDDLGLPAGSHTQPTDDLAAIDDTGLLSELIARAASGEEGQETIQSLLPEVIAFSLHSGRNRGATWLHRDAKVMWLLAAGYHREGSGEDAYEHFKRLKAQRALYPTIEDYEALERLRDNTLAKALRDELPDLIQQARANPGDILEFLLGGRIPIRLAFEDNPGMLTAAISTVFHPGDLQLPREWLSVILASVFPGWKIDDLELAYDIAGEEPREHELIFSALDDED